MFWICFSPEDLQGKALARFQAIHHSTTTLPPIVTKTNVVETAFTAGDLANLQSTGTNAFPKISQRISPI